MSRYYLLYTDPADPSETASALQDLLNTREAVASRSTLELPAGGYDLDAYIVVTMTVPECARAAGYAQLELEAKGVLPETPPMPEDFLFNHHKNFLNAVLGKEKSHSPFEVAVPLTQVLCLGTIAKKLNTVFHFERNTHEILDNPFANALLTGIPPRKGWEDYYKL